MKVLVVGAGIGGAAAAVALQRVGFEVTLFEGRSRAGQEDEGLFLTLAPNGLRALRELELLDAVRRLDPVPTPHLEFVSTSGRSLGTLPAAWLDETTPMWTLMRGALQGALAREAERAGGRLLTGKRLVSCANVPGGVSARFEDGSEAFGEVLLGADGIHSRVRREILRPGPEPSYTGLLNVGGVAENVDVPSTPGSMRMLWGRRAFLGYTREPSGRALWFANLGAPQEPPNAELGRRSTEQWRAQLLELFASDPPWARTLIERTPLIGGWPIHDMPRLPTWHRGRLVLLGDAAHAVSPSAGQGASLALEDALVLAKCLRDLGDPERAIAHYEALRRPRAERVVTAGRRRGEYKAPGSRAALALRDFFMPWALRVFARKSLMSWLYDYHEPWATPVVAG